MQHHRPVEPSLRSLVVNIDGQTWVLTGAGGSVGRCLVEALRARVGKLVLVDQAGGDVEGEPIEQVDIRDRRAVQGILEGAHGVVHLAAISDEADFDDLVETNVVGTRNVLDGARLAGAARVVLASSNRVTGFWPSSETIGTDAPFRPDGFYGVSKVACEALGRLYADKFDVEVVSVRIGTLKDQPVDVRHLSTWLSPRDCAAAFIAAMTAPIDRYAAFYAISRNTRRWWTLAEGEALGFHPVDDAEAHAGRFAGEQVPFGRQGGAFTDVEFSLSRQRPDSGE